MENVIDAKSISRHKVQKYNFKILSSTLAKEEASSEQKTEDDQAQQNDMKETIQNEAPKEVKDDFIAELLEKSDKMSSELVKLQMQIEEGQKEFEQRLLQAKEEYYAKGKEDGFNEAKQKYEDDFEKLKQQYLNSVARLDKTVNECKNYMDSLKGELSEISLEIAKEVIVKEISKSSEEIALALSKKLLEEIKDANSIEIKTNPKDYEYLKQKLQEIKNITISKDEAISEGGVVIISDIGNIDGDIKTRIEKAKQIIMV